jgi:tripartite ATP-independent transporter DctP family solute receptor
MSSTPESPAGTPPTPRGGRTETTPGTPEAWADDFPELPRPGSLWPWITLAALLLAAGLYLMVPARAGPVPAGPVTAPSAATPGPRAAASSGARLAFVDSADSSFALAATALSRRVGAATGGRLALEVLPGGRVDGQRLDELSLIEALQRGEVQMGFVTSSPLSNLDPRYAVLDLPFLFADYQHADQVLEGALGQELLQSLRSQGLVGLGFLEIGFRIFSSSQPMPDLASFQGKRLRVMQSATYINFVRLLGAEPVPSPVDKIYDMGKQGFIDAADRSFPTYWDFKLYEVQRYITETRHAYSVKVMVANRSWFESLAPEDQGALARVAREVQKIQRQAQRSEEERVRRRCVEQDIQIFTLSDEERQKFVARCQPLYQEYLRLESDRGFLERLRAAAAPEIRTSP